MNEIIEKMFSFSPADFRGEIPEDSDRTSLDYGDDPRQFPKTEDEQEFEHQALLHRND